MNVAEWKETTHIFGNATLSQAYATNITDFFKTKKEKKKIFFIETP